MTNVCIVHNTIETATVMIYTIAAARNLRVKSLECRKYIATRASFCCTKKIKKLRLFLTKVAIIFNENGEVA